MTTVVQFRAPKAAHPNQHVQFGLARRAMLAALREWLTTKPADLDVADEIEGTINALRQTVRTRDGAA